MDKLKSDVLAAAKSYDAETKKLNAVSAQTPAFSIQGEINSGDAKGLYVWGIAVTTDSQNNPGWQINDGNLKILNPNPKKIIYAANMYADTDHYYLRTESGTNSFGGKVSVKVYTK